MEQLGIKVGIKLRKADTSGWKNHFSDQPQTDKCTQLRKPLLNDEYEQQCKIILQND